MANVLTVIEPYWYQDTWVFDDVSMGLEKEPLEGKLEDLGLLSSMLDYLVKDIPNARNGFILLFPSQPFVGYQVELTRLREEDYGCLYKVKDSGKAFWLSLALSSYFETAPESLYVKAEPWRALYDPIEVVALKNRIEELEQLVGKLTLENEALRKGRDKLSDS